MPGLEDLYREIILDHHRNPRNRGELAPPAPHAVGHNPLCGDEIDVYLQVENDVVVDVKVGGQGCSISQSPSNVMSSCRARRRRGRRSWRCVRSSKGCAPSTAARSRTRASSKR